MLGAQFESKACADVKFGGKRRHSGRESGDPPDRIDDNSAAKNPHHEARVQRREDDLKQGQQRERFSDSDRENRPSGRSE
jgi:hypothetical protein